MLATMLALLRERMTGDLTIEKKPIDEENGELLFRLAKQYDLAHIISPSVLPLLPQGSSAAAAFKKAELLAVVRYERQAHELARLSRAFSEKGIAHLPLKGAVLRQYYPEPWMRTSCDIDILVKDEDVAMASEVLEGLGLVCRGRTTHDVSFFSSNGTHIELHFALCEASAPMAADKLLEDAWSYACASDGCSYRFTDEMFYFYHIYHMAKHVKNGGCGIRPFLDLFVLENMAHDSLARNALLEMGGLSTFARHARRLSDFWFGEGEQAPETVSFASYILTGGLYGSTQNRIAASHATYGKGRALLHHFFPPYATMKAYHPFLRRMPVLLPFAWIGRLFRILFTGGVSRSAKELGRHMKSDGALSDQTEKLFQTLGL